MKALVLSGGGSKGAYQVGVLKKLLVDDKNEYDIISGISVGALNGAILAQFSKNSNSWDTLKQTWDQVTTKKIRKNWCPFGIFESLWKSSVYNSKPLIKWIENSLSVEDIKTSGKILRIVAVSWDTGEAFVATEKNDDLKLWVAASSAFPVMLSPILINGNLWVDGGLRSITPLGEAIKAGATDIDVVLTADPDLKSPFDSNGKAAIPSLMVRGLDILTNQIMRSDLKIAGLKNDLAGLYKKVNIRVFQPNIDLETIQTSLDFDQKKIQKIIELGYSDACNTLL